jgi:AcrR family transcriptional regulator
MGRPRTLTHDEFLEEALRIVDAEGLDALTFRRLGEEVGVSYTAVYTYFDSRQDLLEELAGRLVANALAGADISDASPRRRLLAIAAAIRSGFSKHPRALPVFLASTREPPGTDTAVAAVIGALEEGGLSGEQLALAYRIFESYVGGATVFDFGAAPEHLSVRRRRYAQMKHPAFKDLSRSQRAVGEHNDDAFLRGLEIILEGFGI